MELWRGPLPSWGLVDLPQAGAERKTSAVPPHATQGERRALGSAHRPLLSRVSVWCPALSCPGLAYRGGLRDR